MSVLECPDWTHFSGSECIECSCNMQNTKSCDKKTGKCLCKTGYEGDLCNCPLNTCNSAVSFCQKTNNGITCLCKPGYENRGFPCKGTAHVTTNETYLNRQIFNHSDVKLTICMTYDNNDIFTYWRISILPFWFHCADVRYVLNR